jgi:DNA-binding HxlR family transcriptional regulator
MDPETRSALQAALDRVGDRWTLLLIAALLDGERRFGDLQDEVAGISPNVLSQRLRTLEADGLVVASPYQSRPPRYAYALTERGRELAGVLRLLASWGAEADDDAPLRHDACGTSVEARWWCPTCGVIVDEVSHLHHL